MSDDIVKRLRYAERQAKKDSREEVIFVDAADEIEKLRAALKPFADEGKLIIREAVDSHFWCGDITIADLRAAKAALGESDD